MSDAKDSVFATNIGANTDFIEQLKQMLTTQPVYRRVGNISVYLNDYLFFRCGKLHGVGDNVPGLANLALLDLIVVPHKSDPSQSSAFGLGTQAIDLLPDRCLDIMVERAQIESSLTHEDTTELITQFVQNNPCGSWSIPISTIIAANIDACVLTILNKKDDAPWLLRILETNLVVCEEYLDFCEHHSLVRDFKERIEHVKHYFTQD